MHLDRRILFTLYSKPWSSLLEGDEGCIGPNGKRLCLRTTQEVMQQHMHGIMPYIFDCWADLVVHLLLLKISMAKLFDQSTCTCFCQVLWALDHDVELSGLVGKGLAIGV